MNNESANIAVAQASGWTQVHKPGAPGLILGIAPPVWAKTHDRHHWKGNYHVVPDFGQDLNAMAMAENISAIYRLSDEWVENLRLMSSHIACLPRLMLDGEPLNQTVAWIVRLPCEKRREAFLRTLNLWEESK